MAEATPVLAFHPGSLLHAMSFATLFIKKWIVFFDFVSYVLLEFKAS